MKRLKLSSLFLIIISMHVFGQTKDHQKYMENYKASKMAFIIKETNLTTEEAGRFFPIYNELQDKLFCMNREVRHNNRQIYVKKEGVTDKEYTDAVDAIINLSVQEAKLNQEYCLKFKRILSPEKIFRLKIAEMRFAKEMLNNRHSHSDKKNKD